MCIMRGNAQITEEVYMRSSWLTVFTPAPRNFRTNLGLSPGSLRGSSAAVDPVQLSRGRGNNLELFMLCYAPFFFLLSGLCPFSPTFCEPTGYLGDPAYRETVFHVLYILLGRLDCRLNCEITSLRSLWLYLECFMVQHIYIWRKSECSQG